MEFTNRLRTERRGGYPACPANAASQIKQKKEVAKPNHLKDRCYSSVVVYSCGCILRDPNSPMMTHAQDCNSRDSKSLVDCQFQTAEQASRHAREVCDACAKDAEYVFVEASEEPKDNDFVLC
ncbi:hypothetical protein PZA11_005241 [Diplocarpon coronariae]